MPQGKEQQIFKQKSTLEFTQSLLVSAKDNKIYLVRFRFSFRIPSNFGIQQRYSRNVVVAGHFVGVLLHRIPSFPGSLSLPYLSCSREMEEERPWEHLFLFEI